ncbi:MAG: hypothetical protein EXS36_15545 [Pedosphaera sp.]|nr:hypothetical protein [Pedosphaera sp.]
MIALLALAGATGPRGRVQAADIQDKKPADERMMSETVRELVRLQDAGLTEGVQAEYVRAKAGVTRPSCDEMIHLHLHHVKDEIIVAMLKKAEETALAQPSGNATFPSSTGFAQPAPQVVYATPTTVTTVRQASVQYDYSASYNYPSYYPSNYPYYGYAGYPSIYLGFWNSWGWYPPYRYGYGWGHGGGGGNHGNHGHGGVNGGWAGGIRRPGGPPGGGHGGGAINHGNQGHGGINRGWAGGGGRPGGPPGGGHGGGAINHGNQGHGGMNGGWAGGGGRPGGPPGGGRGRH